METPCIYSSNQNSYVAIHNAFFPFPCLVRYEHDFISAFLCEFRHVCTHALFAFIDLFTTRHKLVHNGGSPNFKGPLFDKKTTYMAQILQSLSYKVCFIILPKFNSFGLFILILGTSAIMDQKVCCYNMTTSEIGL